MFNYKLFGGFDENLIGEGEADGSKGSKDLDGRMGREVGRGRRSKAVEYFRMAPGTEWE